MVTSLCPAKMHHIPCLATLAVAASYRPSHHEHSALRGTRTEEECPARPDLDTQSSLRNTEGRAYMFDCASDEEGNIRWLCKRDKHTDALVWKEENTCKLAKHVFCPEKYEVWLEMALPRTSSNHTFDWPCVDHTGAKRGEAKWKCFHGEWVHVQGKKEATPNEGVSKYDGCTDVLEHVCKGRQFNQYGKHVHLKDAFVGKKRRVGCHANQKRSEKKGLWFQCEKRGHGAAPEWTFLNETCNRCKTQGTAALPLLLLLMNLFLGILDWH